jgi:gluconolactonase
VETRVIVTGLAFPEGPCVDAGGVLHLVEMASRCVSKIVDGRREQWAFTAGSPNGAAFGVDGNLYICDGGGRWPPSASTGEKAGPADGPSLVQVITPAGVVTPLIAEIDGRPLNSPNDICFATPEGFYFTDPRWANDADGIRLGEICYSTVDGAAKRVHGGIRFPNGLCVTPDGKDLLVDETDTGLIHRFAMAPNGDLAQLDVYADCGPGMSLDGMCFDIEGRLIVTASTGGRIFVIAPGGGRIEQVITLDDPAPTNVCFGGPGNRTLFITEAGIGRVEVIDWPVPGMPLVDQTAR